MAPRDRTNKLGILSIIAALSVPCMGCGALLLPLIPPSQGTDPRAILGGNDERVLIGRTLNSIIVSSTVSFPVGTFVPPDADVAMVDLQSLDSEIVARFLPFDFFFGSPTTPPFASILADGQHLAWLNFDPPAIIVRDLDSGEEVRLLEDRGTGSFLRIFGLVDRYLGLADTEGSTDLLFVFDLESNASIDLGEFATHPYGNVAALGPGVVAVAPRFSGDILLFDWETMTQTAVPMSPDAGREAGPFFADSRMIWVESPERDRAVVRSYELESGEASDVFEFLTRIEIDDGSMIGERVLGAGTAGILRERTFWEPFPLGGQARTGTRYELYRFDGTTLLISEEQQEPAIPSFPPFDSIPTLAGRFVVYRHPIDGDFVVIDSVSGDERRFDPFR